MNFLRRVRWLLRDLTGRRQFDHELESELETFVDMARADHQRRGLSEDEAGRAARIELGGMEQAREAARSERVSVFIETLWQDVRYAGRRMRRQPGFTTVAVLTLALGIGANAAVFSAVRSVLLAPLPFGDSASLVRLLTLRVDSTGREQTVAVSPALFNAVRDESNLIEQAAAQRFRDVLLTGGEGPERIAGIGVSDQWAETLGVQAAIGRTFSREESLDGSRSRVVLLSHAFWQRRFGEDPDALGSTLRLDGEVYTIVGVMPAGFRYPYQANVWTPTTIGGDVISPGDLNVVARLREGATASETEAEIDRIARAVSARHGVDYGLVARPMAVEFGRDPNSSLALLTGGVAFVLLLACINLATLLLARSFDRQNEVALRAALGASRRRQVRQLLTESILLSAGGGLIGTAIAFGVAGSLDVMIPNRLGEVIQTVRLDGPVLAVSVLVSVVTGVVFGLAPALKLTRAPATGGLESAQRAGHRRRRILDVLVAGEVALAMILLVGAGMMVRQFAQLASADVGYQPAGLVRLTMSLSRQEFEDPARRVDTVDRVLQSVRRTPGVEAASATMLQPVPRTTTNFLTGVVLAELADSTASPPTANRRHIAPGYFDTLGMDILQGRSFTDGDTAASEPVVIVSAAAARELWPDRNPIDERVRLTTTNADTDPWHRVIGVVSDQAEPDDDIRKTVYQPYAQGTATLPSGLWLTTSVTLLARIAGDEALTLAGIRQAVWSVDGAIPLYDVAEMSTVIGEPLSDQRLGAALFAGFGTFALLLAALGTYGVLAFSVNRRIPEFGIRIALGAGRAAVLRTVLFEGLSLIGVGLAAGTIAAAGLSSLLASSLVDLPSADAMTWATALLTLSVAGLAACAVPAWRATRVDPIRALRTDA